MKCLSLFAIVLLAALGLSGATIPSITPVMQDSGGWWNTRHKQKLEEIKALGSKIQVVWLGDSITHYMEDDVVWKQYFCGTPYTGLNLGFGGDRTDNLLWRLQNGELDGYSPKCFIIMIGTNNLVPRGTAAMEPPFDTVIGVKTILDLLRKKKPNSKIILCAISPREYAKDADNRIRNEVINRELNKFCDGQDIIWCDWGNQMLDPQGRLQADMCYDALHPTAKGYKVWIRNILPLLSQIVSTNTPPACTVPVPRYDKTYWVSIGVMRNKVAGTSGKSFDVAFLGDDLLEGFYSVASNIRQEILGKKTDMNLALKGDLVENVHWRAKGGELHNYAAKAVIISAGGGNTNLPTEEAVAGVEALVKTVRERQPNAKIVISGIMPYGRTPQEPIRQWAEKVNEGLESLADNSRIFFIDTAKAVLEEDKSLSTDVSQDGLHLTKEGYSRLGAAIEEWLKNYL